MNKKLVSLCTSLLALIAFVPLTQANVPGGFGLEYGLLVTPNRQNQAIDQGAALGVLTQIFPEYAWPTGLNVNDSDSACQIDFLNCKVFFSNAPLNQKMFLTWWSYLQTPKTEFETPEERYLKTWYHMRRNGWLPIVGEELTYSEFQEILYRYTASGVYQNLPYKKGMVLELNEINNTSYPSLKEVDEILANLNQVIPEFTANGGKEEQIQFLQQSQQKFNELREELYQAKHPFKVVPHEMPEDIRQKITDNQLDEVLAQVTYNYSKDISGRRHNVITGLQEISGRLYQPEQTINYFDVLKENGLGDYAMAHNLVGGRSVEGYGGGLCGATTILFQTLLNSGLFHPGEEGTVRYNHSALYLSLYPPGSLGKDAVTYFYSKTLILKNHFDSPILFYTYDDSDKKEITLYLFGNSPYQSVEVSDAVKTGTNRYEVTQTIKPYSGQEEVRYLKSYYPGGLH